MILEGEQAIPQPASSIGEFFFKNGEKHANKICHIDAETGQQESFLSLKERSSRLALVLQNKKITSKDIIAFCSKNTIDIIVPILASFYLGAKVVNFYPETSVRKTKYLLELTTPTMIFVEESSLNLMEDAKNFNSEIIVVGNSSKYTTLVDLMHQFTTDNAFKPVEVDVNDTAVMFFSSGTTGLPKAICHSHYSFLNVITGLLNLDLENERTFYLTTFYSISAMTVLLQSYVNGGCRVISRRRDPKFILETIARYNVTTAFLMPFEIFSVMDFEEKVLDTSSLKYIFTGGTRMSGEQRIKLGALFPNASVRFGYGMSEVGSICLFDQNVSEEFLKLKVESCGRVAKGISLKIVDNGQILEANQKGEIRVKSKALMSGYYKQDNSEIVDEGGFFKTGDVGYYDDDHCVYVTGRVKEMFKFRSWSIVPAYIERVLLEHPAVKEAIVFGIPGGDEGEIPTACITLKNNFTAGSEEIRNFVTERVADAEKLRGGVIIMKEIPKTPTGKLNMSEIKSMLDR